MNYRHRPPQRRAGQRAHRYSEAPELAREEVRQRLADRTPAEQLGMTQEQAERLYGLDRRQSTLLFRWGYPQPVGANRDHYDVWFAPASEVRKALGEKRQDTVSFESVREQRIAARVAALKARREEVSA